MPEVNTQLWRHKVIDLKIEKFKAEVVENRYHPLYVFSGGANPKVNIPGVAWRAIVGHSERSNEHIVSAGFVQTLNEIFPVGQ